MLLSSSKLTKKTSEAIVTLGEKQSLIQRTRMLSKSTYTQYLHKDVFVAANVSALERKISYLVRQEIAFTRSLTS